MGRSRATPLGAYVKWLSCGHQAEKPLIGFLTGQRPSGVLTGHRPSSRVAGPLA